MDWRAALLISAFAVLAGGLMYAPFFLWFRLKDAKRGPNVSESSRVTGAGFLFYVGLVVVLFTGFAFGVVRSDTWFGAQVSTLFGGLGYATLVVLVASVVERTLVYRGVKLWLPPNVRPGHVPRAYLHVTSVPDGEAPLWVREQWVGLSLPLAQSGIAPRTFLISGVLSAPRNAFALLAAMLTGKLKHESGYRVESAVAVDVLALAHQGAAAWWRENTPHQLAPMRYFVFPQGVGTVVLAEPEPEA